MSTTVKRYEIARSVLAFHYAVLGILSVLGAAAISNIVAGEGVSIPALLFALFYAAFVILGWRDGLRMPHTITLTDNGFIVFEGAMRTVAFRASEITAIYPTKGVGYYIVFRHVGGKTEVLNQVTGIEELIKSLHDSNPAIRVVWKDTGGFSRGLRS